MRFLPASVCSQICLLLVFLFLSKFQTAFPCWSVVPVGLSSRSPPSWILRTGRQTFPGSGLTPSPPPLPPRKPIPSSCEGCGGPWEGEVLRTRFRDRCQGSSTSDLHSGLQSSWPGPSAGGRAGPYRYRTSGVRDRREVRFQEALLTPPLSPVSRCG